MASFSGYTLIKSNQELKDLEIMANLGVENSHYLIWVNDGTFGSTGEFIETFIDEVVADNRAKLPDILSIHNYTADSESTFPPEFRNKIFNGDTDTERTEWFQRLNELFDICNGKNYLPNFAVTEYGYSPKSGYDHAPTDTSDEAQAIYYLRAVLMGGTMRLGDSSSGFDEQIGWNKHIYYHHAEDEDDIKKLDYAFFADDDGSGVGNDRVIRDIARKVKINTNFGDEDSVIWIPLFKKTGIGDHLATCGWEVTNNIKWASLWRFVNDDTDGPKYTPLGGSKHDFIVSDDLRGYTMNRYKFELSGSSASWSHKETYTVQTSDYNGSQTKIEISDVDHNPTFLKFTN